MIGWLRGGLLLILAAIVGLQLFVRLNPISQNAWPLRFFASGMGQYTGPNGSVWRAPLAGDGTQQMEAFDRVIMETPRTSRLGGQDGDDRISYVTRSLFWGFPDITTIDRAVETTEGTDAFSVGSKAVYGTLDFGINRDRIERWRVLVEAGG